MKKIFFLFVTLCMFAGCSNHDDEDFFNADGIYLSNHLYIYVVDQNGVDLLDPNNPVGISRNGIQVSFFNKDNKETTGGFQIVERKKEGNPYTKYSNNLNALYLYPNINFFDGNYLVTKMSINWGNGFGKDEIEIERVNKIVEMEFENGQKEKSSTLLIEKIYVNGQLGYEYGQNVWMQDDSTLPHGSSTAFLYLVKAK